MFKKVAMAYEVLSDPHRRHAYDYGDVGSFGGRRGSNVPDIDPFAIFRDFFGGQDPFSMMAS